MTRTIEVLRIILPAVGCIPSPRRSISPLPWRCLPFLTTGFEAGMLAIGYDLVPRQVPWREALRAAGLRRLIMGVLGAGIMFLLPPPYVLPVFSDDEKQQAYLSSVLSLSTLITLGGFVLLAVIG